MRQKNNQQKEVQDGRIKTKNDQYKQNAHLAPKHEKELIKNKWQ